MNFQKEITHYRKDIMHHKKEISKKNTIIDFTNKNTIKNRAHKHNNNATILFMKQTNDRVKIIFLK